MENEVNEGPNLNDDKRPQSRRNMTTKSSLFGLRDFVLRLTSRNFLPGSGSDML
jgi:hypothetical protein